MIRFALNWQATIATYSARGVILAEHVNLRAQAGLAAALPTTSPSCQWYNGLMKRQARLILNIDNPEHRALCKSGPVHFLESFVFGPVHNYTLPNLNPRTKLFVTSNFEDTGDTISMGFRSQWNFGRKILVTR